MTIKRIIPQSQQDAISGIKSSFIDGLTPAQVETYIDNNVTDLASAKEVLKKMGKIILHLAKMM